MTTVKEIFIQDLIQELNNINYHKVEYEGNNSLIDVCYIISVIDQQIDKYTEFLSDITKNNYYINGYYKDTTDGYTNGKIRILIEKPDDEKESNHWADTYDLNYCYFIEFLYDQRHWGYCECAPEDKGYNEKYGCCGNGCDFTAPAFRLIKEIDFGYSSWKGQEKDYWEYEKQFEATEQNKNADVEKFRKEQQKQDLENQIKKLQDELLLLEN